MKSFDRAQLLIIHVSPDWNQLPIIHEIFPP